MIRSYQPRVGGYHAGHHAEHRARCSHKGRHHKRGRSWAMAAVVFLVGAVTSLGWVLAQDIAAATEGLNPFVVLGILLIAGAAFAKGGESFYRRHRLHRNGAPQGPIQFMKEVDITVTYPFWVLDLGNSMLAGFGDQFGSSAGMVEDPLKAKKADNATFGPTFNLYTDATTVAWIREVSLSVDPLVVPTRANTERLDLQTEMVRSYGRMVTALQSGQVTIECTPFPVILATGSQVPVNGGATVHGELPNTVVVSPDLASRGSELLDVFMPQSASFRTLISVPNRSNGAPYGVKPVVRDGKTKIDPEASPEYGFLLTGVVRVVQRNATLLGGSPPHCDPEVESTYEGAPNLMELLKASADAERGRRR